MQQLAAERPASSEELHEFLPRIGKLNSGQMQHLLSIVIPLCTAQTYKAPTRNAYEELVLNGPQSGEEAYGAQVWYNTSLSRPGINIPRKLSNIMEFSIPPEDVKAHFSAIRSHKGAHRRRVTRPDRRAVHKFLDEGGSHTVDTYRVPLWVKDIKQMEVDDEAIRFLLQSAARRTIDRDEYQKFTDVKWINKNKPKSLDAANARLDAARVAMDALQRKHAIEQKRAEISETAQQARHNMTHISSQLRASTKDERAAMEYIRAHTPISASEKARRAHRAHTMGRPPLAPRGKKRSAEETNVPGVRLEDEPEADPKRRPPRPEFKLPPTPDQPPPVPPLIPQSLADEFKEMEAAGEYKQEQFKEVRRADPFEAQPDIVGRWLDTEPTKAEIKTRLAKFEKYNHKITKRLRKSAKDLEFVDEAFTIFGKAKKNRMKTLVEGIIKGDLDMAIWLKKYRFKKFKAKFPAVKWANEAWHPNTQRAKGLSKGGEHYRDLDKAALEEILVKLDVPGDAQLKVQDYSALYRAIGAPESFLTTLKDVTKDIQQDHSADSKKFSENSDAILRIRNVLDGFDRDADLEDIRPIAKKKPRRGQVHSGVQQARAETKKKAAAKKRKPKPRKKKAEGPREGRAAETAQEMDRGRTREAASSAVRTRSQPSRPIFAPDMGYPTRQAIRETGETVMGHDSKRAALGRRSADVTRLGDARAHSPQDRRRRSKALKERAEEISVRARSAGRRPGAYVRRRSRALHRGGSPTGRW